MMVVSSVWGASGSRLPHKGPQSTLQGRHSFDIERVTHANLWYTQKPRDNDLLCTYMLKACKVFLGTWGPRTMAYLAGRINTGIIIRVKIAYVS